MIKEIARVKFFKYSVEDT